MILVIDDCPRRQAGFRKAFGRTIQALSFSEAAAALTLYRNGELSRIYLDCDGVDGERTARRMVEMGLHADAKIFIHSSNLVGAARMRETLEDTHRVEMVDCEEVVG